jgi:mannosyl-oligosaccharide alpha-1,2-mannosidase
MLPLLRRRLFYLCAASSILFFLILSADLLDSQYHRRGWHHRSEIDRIVHPGLFRPKFRWKNMPQQHPVQSFTPLPTGPVAAIPKIQAEFEPETAKQKEQRQARLRAVKVAFLHSWDGYKRNAWLQDEVAPITGQVHNGFGGWGATLVDSLDTLWIMGLDQEFARAVSDLRKIDYSTTSLDTISVFETTIRYIGGFLSAYDISGHDYPILLEKAVELGDMLYHAFDTPNRMPVTRWDWKNKAVGGPQEASRFSSLAEVGSFTLEFTRLTQLTGDPKWYDAIARITDALEDAQNRTKVPGLFGMMLDTQNVDFTRDTVFTFGGMADSLYEYLPKQHLILGGRIDQYRDMYLNALESAKEHIFFRPLNPDNRKLLVAGTCKKNSPVRKELIPTAEHLTCFVGGMVALAAKAFQQTHDLEIARQLVDGCLWAYESMPTGIMPETFTAAPCQGDEEDCEWTTEKWVDAIVKHRHRPRNSNLEPHEAQKLVDEDKLVPGFVDVTDARYNLRPEAIESLFVLYRITGDRTLQDKAWKMFETINNVTKTEIAYAGVKDVQAAEPDLIDTMESFWVSREALNTHLK